MMSMRMKMKASIENCSAICLAMDYNTLQFRRNIQIEHRAKERIEGWMMVGVNK